LLQTTFSQIKKPIKTFKIFTDYFQQLNNVNLIMKTAIQELHRETSDVLIRVENVLKNRATF